jgi:hypothetical protein
LAVLRPFEAYASVFGGTGGPEVVDLDAELAVEETDPWAE